MPDGSFTSSATTITHQDPAALLLGARHLTEMLNARDGETPSYRFGYEGRNVVREVEARFALAVTQVPHTIAETVAVTVAAFDLVQRISNEERTAEEMASMLDGPLIALERVIRFLVSSHGLDLADLGGGWALGDDIDCSCLIGVSPHLVGGWNARRFNRDCGP